MFLVLITSAASSFASIRIITVKCPANAEELNFGVNQCNHVVVS